jgi:hypothetical protein
VSAVRAHAGSESGGCAPEPRACATPPAAPAEHAVTVEQSSDSALDAHNRYSQSVLAGWSWKRLEMMVTKVEMANEMSQFVVTAFWKLAENGARTGAVDIAIREIKAIQAVRHRSQSRISRQDILVCNDEMKRKERNSPRAFPE